MHGGLQGSNGDSFSHRMEVARANRGYNNAGDELHPSCLTFAMTVVI